jgi:hypothetical protein
MDVKCDTYTTFHSSPFLSIPHASVLKSGATVVRFLERVCHCEMEWTQESVIGFIELYTRKEIICDPKHPMHFNKIKKAR